MKVFEHDLFMSLLLLLFRCLLQNDNLLRLEISIFRHQRMSNNQGEYFRCSFFSFFFFFVFVSEFSRRANTGRTVKGREKGLNRIWLSCRPTRAHIGLRRRFLSAGRHIAIHLVYDIV